MGPLQATRALWRSNGHSTLAEPLYLAAARPWRPPTAREPARGPRHWHCHATRLQGLAGRLNRSSVGTELSGNSSWVHSLSTRGCHEPGVELMASPRL